MGLKGGDQADDPIECQFRNLGGVMVCRHFCIGVQAEAKGDAGEGLVLEHVHEVLRLAPGVAWLDASHGTVTLLEGLPVKRFWRAAMA